VKHPRRGSRPCPPDIPSTNGVFQGRRRAR
jgi:hypothetical protein